MRNEAYELHIFIGLFLALTATVLLLLTTFSVPFIKSIYFLKLPSGLTFGGFGWCGQDCSSSRVGYKWDPQIIVWLMSMHIFFGIAAAFSLLALVFLVLSMFERTYTFHNPYYFRTAAIFAALTSLFAEICSLALWITARFRFDDVGVRATYGPAMWLGLTGAIAANLSLCLGGPRFTGRFMYRADAQAAYNV